MSKPTREVNITISLADLEMLIRRVVREAVHEEFLQLLRKSPASILEDLQQEGPNDPAGDQELLAEALVTSKEYHKNKEGWKNWEDFKKELKAAEDAGELPN